LTYLFVLLLGLDFIEAFFAHKLRVCIPRNYFALYNPGIQNFLRAFLKLGMLMRWA